MQIHIHTLYPSTPSAEKIQLHVTNSAKRSLSLLLAIAVLIAPFSAVKTADVQPPKQQDFVLTAYYSPIAGQCCYVKGGLQADRILNGEGHTAADGTPVYPGLIAAPGTYPFGTVVHLPGYGTFKVHDRGGAIQEWNNGKHRLDLWVGFGEEGLARALQLGLKEVRGTIYYPGTKAPEVSFNFDAISAPVTQLERFLVNDNLLNLSPSENQKGLSVSMLQEHLHTLGYLDEMPTGFFGPKTKDAYQSFLHDFHIDAPSDALTKEAAAVLLSAVARKNRELPLDSFVNASASSAAIKQSQRLLRNLGYYKGRITGTYDEALSSAILRYQQEYKLVGQASDPGAGQIGPITKKTLTTTWNKKRAKHASEDLLVFAEVEQMLKKKNVAIESFAAEGSNGPNVLKLQQLLADLGFFAAADANGNFGEKTKEAVTQYQISRSLIPNALSPYAGIVGPKTLLTLQREQSMKSYKIVRAYGFDAL